MRLLTLPRRLSIALLHEAQIAAPNTISGWVLAHNGVPTVYSANAPADNTSSARFARVYSHPTAAAVPTAEQASEHPLTLMISLTTKGVLQMRAWQLTDGAVQEIPVAVAD